METGLPLLSAMLITLPLGAALIWLAPSERQVRWIALLTALLDLLLALVVLAAFDSTREGFQLVERIEWIPSLNLHYHLGVDGFSVAFLPLTVLLFNAVLLASWNSVRTLPRLYYTLLLLLESTTLGIFLALDTMLFFLFWELTLVPIYFLVSLWGVGPHRRYAAVKYTLFMMVGGVPLLFGFLVLAFGSAGLGGGQPPHGLVFDYETLLAQLPPRDVQVVVFFLLLTGFAAKTPVFPLHTWLPTVAMEGPIAVAAIMTGLKIGVYGIIRFVVPLAPEAALQYHWLLAGLGVVGLLYGALAALGQTNLRRMLAFSSVSHVGLVLLGIASLNLQGLQGAVFQLLNFTIVAGALFLVTGFLHHRTGSTDIISLGGVAVNMPLLAAFFFFFGLASMGVPGTNGFPAEFLLVMGALSTHTGAGLAALVTIVLGAGYFLGIYRRAFLGPVQSDVIGDAVDLGRRELLLVVTLATLVLLLGLWPQGVLEIIRVAGESWVRHLGTAAGVGH
ncbi:MAG: NADH-quinone oxidoreductase subunit M [Gammaproteobacteria bacterium]|jgi:NADH-quinone oxidoreductase subunit M